MKKKFECEICNKLYDTEKEAIECEKNHLIKKIDGKDGQLEISIGGEKEVFFKFKIKDEEVSFSYNQFLEVFRSVDELVDRSIKKTTTEQLFKILMETF